MISIETCIQWNFECCFNAIDSEFHLALTICHLSHDKIHNPYTRRKKWKWVCVFLWCINIIVHCWHSNFEWSVFVMCIGLVVTAPIKMNRKNNQNFTNFDSTTQQTIYVCLNGSHYYHDYYRYIVCGETLSRKRTWSVSPTWLIYSIVQCMHCIVNLWI